MAKDGILQTTALVSLGEIKSCVKIILTLEFSHDCNQKAKDRAACPPFNYVFIKSHQILIFLLNLLEV